MPLSSCDENRLQLAQQAQAHFDAARKLAKTDDHAGALASYLFAFDNSLAVDGWGGVRLSYIPAEIAELGQKYPPAIAALRTRRDSREQLIRDGETNYDVLAEWSSLNQYLADKDRELDLLKELGAVGKLDDSLKKKIIESNFERLLDDKNYEMLAEYFDNFGHSFMFNIFHYEKESLFRREIKNRPAEFMDDYWKVRIISEGAKVYELALGIKKMAVADEIAKRILAHCNPVQTYTALLAAALSAGSKQKARQLKAQAKSVLTAEDYARLQADSA